MRCESSIVKCVVFFFFFSFFAGNTEACGMTIQDVCLRAPHYVLQLLSFICAVNGNKLNDCYPPLIKSHIMQNSLSRCFLTVICVTKLSLQLPRNEENPSFAWSTFPKNIVLEISHQSNTSPRLVKHPQQVCVEKPRQPCHQIVDNSVDYFRKCLFFCSWWWWINWH